MSFLPHELLMLQGKRPRTGLFDCGHAKRPSNAYVIRKDGELYIRCRACHRIASQRSYERGAENA